MPNFCLVKPLADKFKQAIKSGEINISKLSDMTSAERHSYFSEMFNDRNAKEINALFESKLLLKNQKAGLVTWAKQVSGMKPELKNTLIDKIAKMDKILAPTDQKTFLQDLASKRLGTGITIEEANKIVEMSRNIEGLKNFKDLSGRVDYGKAKLNLVDYVNGLSGKKAGIIKNALGVPRAVLATLDLSAPLNQGWGMISRPEFYTNLGTMMKAARSDEAFKTIQAEILTRETFKDAKKAGLRINSLGEKLEDREEVFMTTLLDKVPGVAHSERAYTAFLNKLRMDVYDNIVKKAAKNGEDVGAGSKVLEDIAKSVNIFTGGYGKTNEFANAMLFSPRKLQSSLQILNPATYLNPKVSKTVRMESLRNLLGSVSVTASMIGAAKLLGGDNVSYETDRTSSDFGKIKVGDARIDVSGGNAAYVTLLSRLMPESLGGQRIKSATTDVSSKLGAGFGTTDAFNLITKFGRNKLSPIASLIVDITSGENAIGQKVAPTEAVINRFKPMFLNNLWEIYNSDVDYKPVIASLALLGANVSIYNADTDWSTSTSQDITQFKTKFGEGKLKEANDKYNLIINDKIEKTKKTDEYKNASNEDKTNIMLKIKTDAKKEVFKGYGFKKTLPSKKK